jgi:hypothetical protein
MGTYKYTGSVPNIQSDARGRQKSEDAPALLEQGGEDGEREGRGVSHISSYEVHCLEDLGNAPAARVKRRCRKC